MGQCEVPGVPVLNKQAPKGEADILKITPTVTWCGYTLRGSHTKIQFRCVVPLGGGGGCKFRNASV